MIMQASLWRKICLMTLKILFSVWNVTPFLNNVKDLRVHVNLFYIYVMHFQFKEPTCSQDFSQRSIILEHHKSVHEGNPFKCTKCQKTFTFNKVLQNHLKVTHKKSKSELKYVCDACGKGFNNHNHFQKHSDRHKDQKSIPTCSLKLQALLYISIEHVYEKLHWWYNIWLQQNAIKTSCKGNTLKTILRSSMSPIIIWMCTVWSELSCINIWNLFVKHMLKEHKQ